MAKEFQKKLDLAKNRMYCNYAFYFGATANNTNMLSDLKEKCQESDTMKNNLTTVAFVKQPTEDYDSNIIYDVINGITGMFSNNSLEKLQEELIAEESENQQSNGN